MTTPNQKRLQNVRGVGKKRYQRILEKLKEMDKGIDELFKMSSSEISKTFALPKNVAEAIAKSRLSSQPQSEEAVLQAKGIKILKRGSEDYPKRLEMILGKNAPETLYIWGNSELLNKPAVGFCGSRAVTQKGLDITADTTQQVSEMGWVVVSGHARGVDATAHRVALENGGSTIIVAPQGILDFKLRQELKKIAKPEQLLIISEFSPNDRWQVYKAMKRNNTIVALSDAMVLVEARDKGGTFEAGKTALRLKVPLYVVEYQTPGESAAGNVYFLKKGAKSLKKNSETGNASIDSLRNTVRKKRLNGFAGMDEQLAGENSKQLSLIAFENEETPTKPPR